MTPTQVAAAMAGQAPLKRGGRLENKRVENKGTFHIAKAKLRSSYYYDASGLALVMLQAKPNDCAAIYREVVSAHGQPLLVSDQILFKLHIWHDQALKNRIRLMTSSASVCDLHYERLSDYEAYDLSRTSRP